VLLAGVTATGGLTLSPDERTLLYSDCGARSQLYDVTTDPTRPIVDDRKARQPALGAGGVLAWAHVTDRGQVLMARIGGQTVQLTTPELGSIRFPAFDRAGKQIAFAVGGPTGGIHVVSIDSSRSAQRVTDDPTDEHPVWAGDGRIAFTRYLGGKPYAHAIAVGGGELTRIGTGNHTTMGFSNATGEVLLGGQQYSWWDPRTGKQRPGPAPKLRTTYSVLSPDGRWLALQSGPHTETVWRMRVDDPASAERHYTAPHTISQVAIGDDGHVVAAPEVWSGDLFAVPLSR
jgi:Tol biopolymer transport system component